MEQLSVDLHLTETAICAYGEELLRRERKLHDRCRERRTGLCGRPGTNAHVR